MSHYVGVDVGSFSCKAAVLDEDRVVGAVVSPSGSGEGRWGAGRGGVLG